MHVAYLSLDAGIPVFGHKGASNHIAEFVKALTRLGHEVTLFAARQAQPSADLPCRLQLVPAPSVQDILPDSLQTEVLSLARNESLRNLLEQTHETHAVDLVYERYALWSFEGLDFARLHGLPYVLEVNSPLRIEQKKFRRLHLEPAARAIERLLFSSATLVAGVSQSVIDYVTEQAGRHLPALVVPNGVDLELFRSVPAAAPGPFTIGFVGSLKPWHGIEILMDAFRFLANGDFRLLIVGEGPLRRWVEQYSQEHGLAPFVSFTGGVEKTRMPALLGRMDVAVAPYPPTQDFYFSPLKVFEYMAAGRAIVASRIGQVAELLEDGRTALLAEPGNPHDLVAKIRRLWDDPALRQRIGQAAREEAFRCHGWDDRVRLVLESYASV